MRKGKCLRDRRHPAEIAFPLASWQPSALASCRRPRYGQGIRPSCNKRVRLLTEAQWEYACRAGTTALYYFGDDQRDFDDYGWGHTNSKALTHPVAQKKPNAWGLYDMLGNVWEWVEDDYVRSHDGGPSDDSAGLEGKMTKVLRGGSWSNSTRFWICGSGARFNSAAGNVSNEVGFRVVLPLGTPPHKKFVN